MQTLLVNLFGGPGTGKTTTMHGLIFELRNRGHLSEMAPEYIKSAVWEGRRAIFEDQLYILAKQSKIIRDRLDKVDVVVTDSPTLLTLVYSPSTVLHQVALTEIDRQSPSLNVMLTRIKPYEPRGRFQTETEARMLDTKIRELFARYDIPFLEIAGAAASVPLLADHVETLLCRGAD